VVTSNIETLNILVSRGAIIDIYNKYNQTPHDMGEVFQKFNIKQKVKCLDSLIHSKRIKLLKLDKLMDIQFTFSK
jgi:hypothetical protein